MSKKILLVTGPAGEFQGWGNLKTTELIKEAIEYSGKEAKIVYVESAKQFLDGLKKNTFDIVWSALYHLSQKSGSVGVVSDEPWVADILDEKSLPYIGSSSDTMKNLIDKSKTNKILYDHNIAVP